MGTKVLLVGPIETKGRYSGGIAYIMNSLIDQKGTFIDHGMDIVPVDSCCIQRKINAEGKLTISNLVNTLAFVRLLKRKIKEEKPDVVYFNTSIGYSLLKDLLALKWAGSRNRTKTILHIHFADAEKIFPSQAIFRRKCRRLIDKYVDHIVLLSEKTREELITDGYDEKKISVIYNFHTQNFTIEEIEAKQHKTVTGKKDILFIGSLDKRKGVIDLIDAFVGVEQGSTLHLCGAFTNEEIRISVENKIKQLPQGSVVMHGFVKAEEKRNILGQCEIMVLPSYGEGFPIVLLEGLTAGCGIIATNVGAISEVFNEKTGIIIPPGNVTKLRTALTDMISDENLPDTMMNNWLLSSDFSINRFIEKMCNVCEEVVNG